MNHIKFSHVSTTTVRETLANGHMDEVDESLQKRYCDMLGWGALEQDYLMDMAIDTLHAKLHHTVYEVKVRSLCHCQAVTADYLNLKERFQMHQCVLVMGDAGVIKDFWVQLVQPAVDFFKREYNVLFVDVPELRRNPHKWLQHGPPLVRGALKFMNVQECSALATGVGGAVVLQAIIEDTRLFRKTHHVFNVNFPKGLEGKLPVDFDALELHLRAQDVSPLQLWFAYQDVPEVYDRNEGSAWKASYEVSRLQARVESMRRRGKRQEWDEILVTDNINTTAGAGGRALGKERSTTHVERLAVGKTELLVFSAEYMQSLDDFLKLLPSAAQDDLVAGLFVPVSEKEASQRLAGLSNEKPELPAVRKLKVGPTWQDRAETFERNRRRWLDLDHGAFRVLDGQQPLAITDAAARGHPALADAAQAQSAGRLLALPQIAGAADQASPSQAALAPTSQTSPSAVAAAMRAAKVAAASRPTRRSQMRSHTNAESAWMLYGDDSDDEDETFFTYSEKGRYRTRVTQAAMADEDSDEEDEDDYIRQWAGLRGMTNWREYSKIRRGSDASLPTPPPIPRGSQFALARRA